MTQPITPETTKERDIELIERCLKHDRKAWHEFVERYSRDIFATVVRVLRRYGIDAEQHRTDDMFQLAFDRLYRDDYRRLRQWSRRCSLKTWVCLVTSSAVVDDLRKRRPLSMDVHDEERFRRAAVAPQTSALQLLERADDIRAMRQALQTLSATDRQLLVRLFLEDAPVDRVAAEFQITRGALYTRKNRAVARLREAITALRFQKANIARKDRAAITSRCQETNRERNPEFNHGPRRSQSLP